MKKLQLFLLAAFLLCFAGVQAQVVVSEPAIIQQGTQNIIIKFNAAEGNGGLKGVTADVYAHTGVITNKSISDSDWKYAPQWLDNNAKYKLTNIGTNLWTLSISDIRAYYGITDPTEQVQRLAFVFRNSTGSKQGKGGGDTDLFVDVYPDGLAVSATSNAVSNILTDANSNVTITATSTIAADLKLFMNTVDSQPIASATADKTLSYTYNFPVGSYDIIAQASANGSVERDTISFCHRGNSQAVNYSGTLKQGATVNGDGSVTFCLYAPAKSNVILVGEWDDYKVKNERLMNYQGNRMFWTNVSGLDMNKDYAYYFIVDDNIIVADPYAKLILDPWSDKYINQNSIIYPDLKPFPAKVGNNIVAVFRGNEQKYNWSVTDFKAPSKENLIIYELLFRDFTDEKSVNAALAKLDYLANLGINAIELMPIMEFDGNESWGYNPNFYFAPDKAYGTKQDYQRFIDECHKRGIAVILDIVFNHTWGQHPWCKMYWDSANNRPSADNPFQNAVAPHAWSVGNDWKLENTDVQAYFCDVLKYWIEEYKVDGYRFDLVKGLANSATYAGDYDGNKYNESRIANMRKFSNAMHEANPNSVAIFESFISSAEESAMGEFGMSWKKLNYNYSQAAMGYQNGSSFSGMESKDGKHVGFMESHDEERVAYTQTANGATGIKGNVEISMRRLGANAAFAFLVPGAKMIWQFGELGYDLSLNYGGSNVAPKPTRWDYLNNEYRKGLYDSYSEIIRIRKNNPDLFSSTAEFYPNYSQTDWNGGRFITIRNQDHSKELVVVYNPNAQQRIFEYTFNNQHSNYFINSKSYNTTPSFNASTGKITVPAHSYVVISNMADPTGVEDVISDDKNSGKITIFPNPAADYVQIASDAVSAVEIFSLSGGLVLRSTDSNSVDVSNLVQGTYLMRITADGIVYTQKLLKK